MKIFKLVLLINFFIFGFLLFGNCQTNWVENSPMFKAANISVNVDFVDSIYVCKVLLRANGTENFFINENMEFKDFFSRGNSSMANYEGNLFLTKIVMGRDVIFAPNDYNRLYGSVFDSSGNLVQIRNKNFLLNQNDSIKFNIKLNDIYPLEIGNYILEARIKIKCKETIYFVYSEPFSFSVNKLPPKTAFYHY